MIVDPLHSVFTPQFYADQSAHRFIDIAEKAVAQLNSMIEVTERLKQELENRLKQLKEHK